MARTYVEISRNGAIPRCREGSSFMSASPCARCIGDAYAILAAQGLS
jgi:hypothetical protein